MRTSHLLNVVSGQWLCRFSAQATGIAQTLCELLKSATRQTFAPSTLSDLYNFFSLYDTRVAKSSIPMNPLLRRLRAKYAGRLAAAYLPPSSSITRRAVKAQPGLLGAQEVSVGGPQDEDIDIEFDVPEEVEALTSDLLEILPDPVSGGSALISNAQDQLS